MTTNTQIDTLEAKGLVRLATVRPELEYLFRHWLVQDAAYGSLLKQERRELHGQVGEALEQLYPERRSELAPVLAMHFEQAGENDKAIDYYADGGAHALAANAIKEAFNAFDRASTLSQDAAPGEAPTPAEIERRRRRQVEVQIGRAQAGYSFLPMEESFENLERVVADADAIGDPQLIARLHMLIALGRLQSGEAPSNPIIKRSLARIADMSEELGDPSLRALPIALPAIGMVFTGPVREGVAALEVALPLMEKGSDSIASAFARGSLAIGYAYLGEFEKADKAAASAREIAAERGDLIAQLDALIAESMVSSAKGELDKAVPLAQECVDRAEETGATACVIASSWVLGDAFHRQGRFGDAARILKRGADVSLVVDRKMWRPTLLAWLSSTSAAMGEHTESDWDADLETARSIRNHIGVAGMLAKRGEGAARRGDIDAAVADFEAAAASLEGMGLRPALARLLRGWGEALRASGRQADADPVLRRSLALFEELGLTREAGEVRTTMSVGGATLAFD